MALAKYPPLLHYKSLMIESVHVSYIEAGNPEDPALLLFAGYPSSANEFRKLAPLLAQVYHVISPSYPAFGLTSTHPDFQFVWSNVANVIGGLLVALNISSYAIYCHGYGADVGFPSHSKIQMQRRRLSRKTGTPMWQGSTKRSRQTSSHSGTLVIHLQPVKRFSTRF